jgi:UDP-N-acetylglucosamine:LPS N-acetylglucosamine transferase
LKIFLTAYGGGHITSVIPVFKTLVQRGHTCTLMALTTAGEVARREGLPHLRPIDCLDEDDATIQQPGSCLAERHHTDGKGISRAESIAYLGVSFRDLARDLGVEQAWRRYKEQGLNAFTPVHFMRDVLKMIQPDVVVATTSPRMEKAALRAAFQLNIPSLCMVELFGIQEEPWLSRPDNGHVLTVSRPDVARRLVAAGRQTGDIHCIGSPMFDYLADPQLREAGHRWRQHRGVRSDEKLLFWAEQPEPADPELPRRIRHHLAAISRARGWRLVVRLHPSSTDASKESIPAMVLQSHSDEPLAEVVSACDAGITLTSTVGWELLLADKPLLVLRLSPNQSAVTYGEDDGALTIDRLEEAEEALAALLTETSQAHQLARLRRQLPRPGGAAQRICDLIEQVVEPRHYSLELNRHCPGGPIS